MPATLSDPQLMTLRAICDTAVPRIERPDDPDGFWRRRATDVGADQALRAVLDGMPPEQRAGMHQLLDVLAEQDFARMSQQQCQLTRPGGFGFVLERFGFDQIPAQIQRGQRSDVISEEDARALVQTLPRARFIDLKGAGHMIAGDANDAFAASVAAFLHEVMPSTQSPSGEI